MDPIVVNSLLTLVTDLELWGLMLAAIPMGMMFGAVPGLGGKLGIVVAIPFIFGLEPVPGSVFLLAMHSVVHTGGSIPSILLGIPGTGPDAATVCDGHPMARRGEAGRALGASLAASVSCPDSSKDSAAACKRERRYCGIASSTASRVSS